MAKETSKEQLANEQQITSERRKQLDVAKQLDALKDKSRQIENDILSRVEKHRDVTFSLTGNAKKLNSMSMDALKIIKSKVDADGNADLDGYECKVDSERTSWGDWGAPYRIFCDKSYGIFDKKNAYENMWILVKSLGVLRDDPVKGIFYSMSGQHVPTYINDETYIVNFKDYLKNSKINQDVKILPRTTIYIEERMVSKLFRGTNVISSLLQLLNIAITIDRTSN